MKEKLEIAIIQLSRIELLLGRMGKRALLFIMLSARILCMMRMTCAHGEYTKNIELAATISPRECRRRCAGFKFLVVNVMHKEFCLATIQSLTIREISLALKHINSLKALTTDSRHPRKTCDRKCDSKKQLHGTIRAIARAIRRLDPQNSDAVLILFQYLQRRGTKGLERLGAPFHPKVPNRLPLEKKETARKTSVSTTELPPIPRIALVLDNEQQLSLPIENN
ncbi:MAG TPA: hypothetical protein VGH19_18525 [Verrucomicrobiae bacterium]